MADPDNPKPRYHRWPLNLLALFLANVPPIPPRAFQSELPPPPTAPVDRRPTWFRGLGPTVYRASRQREPVPWRTDADRIRRAEEKRERRIARNLAAERA